MFLRWNTKKTPQLIHLILHPFKKRLLLKMSKLFLIYRLKNRQGMQNPRRKR